MTECAMCGITTGDLPYEELGLDPEEADDLLFDGIYCQVHAQIRGNFR